MSLRKHGTGEILPEETGVQKTSTTQQQREDVIKDVLAEDQQADEEK
jgi:hypothetical protein